MVLLDRGIDVHTTMNIQHLETRTLEGANLAKVLVDFAHVHRITQLFVSRPPRRSGLLDRFDRSLVHEIVRLADDMQVTIVAERRFTAAPISR